MKRAILTLAAIVSLSACVSLLPEPVVPQALYRLGPIDTREAVEIDHSVLVRQPEAPRVLAGTSMTARDARDAIRLVEGVEWADRLPRLLQMTVLDYLSTDGRGAAVLPETGARADYELAWRISEFSLQGSIATAQVELTLLDSKSRQSLAQKTASSTVRASGDAASQRAEAMAEAGRSIARQAAVFVFEGAR